jgi:hypothetical protein
VTDDTAAFQKAVEKIGTLVYVPDGTYLVSGRIAWSNGERKTSRIILQGQSRDNTILRLKDNCEGYQDPAQPQTVLYTGRAPAQRFRNAVRNLTIDTGTGNPGAVGLRFMANNQGGVLDVAIRSADGRGAVGLDLAYTNEQGPCLIRNVHVIGFDVGIHTRHAVDGVVMENVSVENQNVAGIVNEGQCLSVAGLRSLNRVPAVRNAAGPGLIALIDADLRAPDSSSADGAAIVNDAGLFLRNVHTAGYTSAVQTSVGQAPAGATIAEWTSHDVASLFPSPRRSLGLPIKQTPVVPWDAPETWVNVRSFPPRDTTVTVPNGEQRRVKDWTEAFQKAIDSGATINVRPSPLQYIQVWAARHRHPVLRHRAQKNRKPDPQSWVSPDITSLVRQD